MLVLIASDDTFLSNSVSSLLREEGFKFIRTNNVERIMREVKKPGRLTIVDVNWEPVQERGVLKQMVNIGRITDNKLVCICSNQEEELKKLAMFSKADEVFIRYDLHGRFNQFLKRVILEMPKENRA